MEKHDAVIETERAIASFTRQPGRSPHFSPRGEAKCDERPVSTRRAAQPAEAYSDSSVERW